MQHVPPPVAPPALVAAVREAIARHGIAALARRLGVSRQTLATIAAGLSVRRGSILVVEAGLRTWTAA
jgi:DNA-binding XRE family transcriptional regulator